MSKLHLATYKLNQNNVASIKKALYTITGVYIKCKKLESPNEIKEFIKSSKPIYCKLLIIEEDHFEVLRGLDFDINQPLAIIQLWKNLTSLKDVPVKLTVGVTSIPIGSKPKVITIIMEQIIDELSAKWERIVRQDIQLECDRICKSINKKLLKTSTFLDQFIDDIKTIVMAESVTLGCCLDQNKGINIIYQNGDSVINFQDQSNTFKNDNKELECKSIRTQTSNNLKKIICDSSAKEEQYDLQQFKIFKSNFNMIHYSQICVIYEFNSALPEKILYDICHTATREIRKLKDYCIGKASHDSLKVILQAQQNLLSEEPLKEILIHLKEYFNANGSSVFRVMRRDGNTLDLKKTYMHFGRYDEKEYTHVTHGFAHHCISNKVALICSSKEQEDNNYINNEYEVNGLFKITNRNIKITPHIRKEDTEKEKSMMLLPLFSVDDKSKIIGAIKIGDFKNMESFLIRDLVDLKLFGEALSFLIYTLDITEQLEEERDTGKNHRKMIKNVEQLFFWREIAIGVLHQIINYLSEADNQIIYTKFMLDMEPKELNPEINLAMSKARESIRLGKTLIKDTHKRGKNLQPCMEDAFLIEDILKPAVLHVNKNLIKGRRNWEITHSFTDKDYKISADIKLARECFINLLNNAVWAVSNRKITNKKVFVVVRPSEDESLVKIEVQDSGIGISREDTKRLFTPFFTRRENGTGLGLFFARKIIQEYFAGKIELSRPNKDTTFVVSLPLFQVKK